MATKIKKSYDQTAKEQKYGRHPKTEEAKEKVDPRERQLYPNEAVLPAAVWRRLLAYLIDFTLSLATTSLMIYSASVPETPSSTGVLMLVSAFIIQLWLFGFLPAEYIPGQTVGEKLLRIYVRQTESKKPLGVWRSMLRGYVYGVLWAGITIPFEFLTVVIQYFMGKAGEPKRVQNLPVSSKALTLPRDLLFNVEVIYPPKH